MCGLTFNGSRQLYDYKRQKPRPLQRHKIVSDRLVSLYVSLASFGWLPFFIGLSAPLSGGISGADGALNGAVCGAGATHQTPRPSLRTPALS